MQKTKKERGKITGGVPKYSITRVRGRPPLPRRGNQVTSSESMTTRLRHRGNNESAQLPLWEKREKQGERETKKKKKEEKGRRENNVAWNRRQIALTGGRDAKETVKKQFQRKIALRETIKSQEMNEN